METLREGAAVGRPETAGRGGVGHHAAAASGQDTAWPEESKAAVQKTQAAAGQPSGLAPTGVAGLTPITLPGCPPYRARPKRVDAVRELTFFFGDRGGKRKGRRGREGGMRITR